MSLSIRSATREDIPLILELIRALAEYEREPHAVKATEADLGRTLFDEGATAYCVLCEQDGVALGFAVYFFNYSDLPMALDTEFAQWLVGGAVVPPQGVSIARMATA